MLTTTTLIAHFILYLFINKVSRKIECKKSVGAAEPVILPQVQLLLLLRDLSDRYLVEGLVSLELIDLLECLIESVISPGLLGGEHAPILTLALFRVISGMDLRLQRIAHLLGGVN